VVGRGKIFGSVRLALFALAFAVPASSAQAAVCVRPGDEPAVNARVMQSELMVAALACDQAASYNAVVRKFQTDLSAGGMALKKMFREAYGVGADRELGEYVTVLANGAAHRSAVEKGRFCNATAGVFDKVIAMDRAEFREFIAGPAYAGRHGLAACPRDTAER